MLLFHKEEQEKQKKKKMERKERNTRKGSGVQNDEKG